MQSRRRFLGTLSLPAAAAAVGLPLRPVELRASALDIALDLGRHPGSPTDIAADEDFWFEVARAFTVDRTLVNLNNGGVSPSPGWVQDAMKRHLDFSNLAPSYTMWTVLEPQREGVRDRMARSGWVIKCSCPASGFPAYVAERSHPLPSSSSRRVAPRCRSTSW